MYIFHSKHTKGFTLIEFLLYLGLTVAMVAILGSIGVDVIESRTKAHVQEEIQYNVRFAFGQMSSLISEAESISTPSTDATSSSLSLVMADANMNPTVLGLVNGGIQVTEGNNAPFMLTTSGVTVTSLVFSNVSSGNGSSQGIKIDMGVDAYNGEGRHAFAIQEDFGTTVALRK